MTWNPNGKQVAAAAEFEEEDKNGDGILSNQRKF